MIGGARRAAAPVALAAYAALLVAFAPGDDWRPEWDSALYLLTARSLDRGEGYRYLGEPFFLRPPGLAWGLAALADDGAFDFARLNRAVAVCAAAAVVAIFWAWRRGLGDAGALAVALLTGTSGVFASRLDWVDSEFPFLLCLFAGAACLDAAARRGADGGPRAGTWSPAAVAGIAALAAAIHLRTVAVLALPAVAAASLARGAGRARRAGPIWALALGLLALPWALEAGARARQAERPAEQMALFDYATAVLRVDPGDPASALLAPGDWRRRVERNGARIAADLSATVLGTQRLGARLLLGVAVGAGLALALRRGPAIPEGFALAYAALLLLYFAYVPRLLLPLLPVVYASLVRLAREAAARGARRFGHPRAWGAAAAAGAGALLAVNALALPDALAAGARPMGVALDVEGAAAGERVALGTQADRWDDYRRAATWLREHTPEDAVLAADFAPVVSLLSERRTVTTRYQRRPDLLGRAGVDYAVCFWWTRAEFEREAASRARRRTALPSHFAGQTIRIYELAPRADRLSE